MKSKRVVWNTSQARRAHKELRDRHVEVVGRIVTFCPMHNSKALRPRCKASNQNPLQAFVYHVVKMLQV